ncbi:MAG: hypothetical protein ABIP88_04925 [Candidatus Binatia bacterium]
MSKSQWGFSAESGAKSLFWITRRSKGLCRRLNRASAKKDLTIPAFIARQTGAAQERSEKNADVGNVAEARKPAPALYRKVAIGIGAAREAQSSIVKSMDCRPEQVTICAALRFACEQKQRRAAL